MPHSAHFTIIGRMKWQKIEFGALSPKIFAATSFKADAI